MGKFNRALVFSTPFIIYALGLWGSRQALIGTIVYMLWIFIGLDEAEYRAKKPVGRDWLMEIIYFYKDEENNIPIVVEHTNNLSSSLLNTEEFNEMIKQFPEAKNNLYVLVGRTEFKLNA